MKSHYRAVVIGGGVVGASVLYHLAKLGWREVALIERSVLTAGSSWHAAGGVHALNADPNMSALQAYTIDLLPRIAEESGIDIGLHVTGGISFASTPERWEWLRHAFRVYQTMGIETCRLVSVEEIAEMLPVLDTTGIYGGLYDAQEGYVDTTGVVQAYARAARNMGAEVIEHNRVLELHSRPGPAWEVVTEKGTLTAEHVVNAGGLWARRIGRMVGVDHPVAPLAHHYLVTETIPEIAALDREIPFGVDLDGGTYMRQEGRGMLLGIYEKSYRHWAIDGAPWDYGIELLPEEIDRIGEELEAGFRRYPCLERAGIRRWVCGAFTFTPDGNPLVGPVAGVPNYWAACGVMAGFLQGGGVGKTLAEWMIEGEPETDAFGMDLARYGDFAARNPYLRQTTGQFYSRRFAITYPNEQLWAGRPLRVSPIHRALEAAGARFGVSWGLEVPLYFAPEGFEERPTLRRSNAHGIVGEECRRVRSGVGLVDITGFARYEVTGPRAREWLDRLLAGRLPAPGRARLSPMLAPSGRLKGDLTVLNWGDGRWWVMGSYQLRAWHMRWFLDHLEEGVAVCDISDAVAGLGVVGPRARELLARVSDGDVSNEALPFMGLAILDVGLVRARVARISVCGELGYEVNCGALELPVLYGTLKAAGQELGVVDFGYSAMNSMRLEKSFGAWSKEYTQGYTPGETGLDRWIDWDKGDFIGRAAALAERERGPARRLVTLEVEADDADALGFEPVWQAGRRVGFVTSGGYGHVVGKSLALALVEADIAAPGTGLTVHVVGEERPAVVIPPSPWDPEGTRMRG